MMLEISTTTTKTRTIKNAYLSLKDDKKRRQETFFKNEWECKQCSMRVKGFDLDTRFMVLVMNAYLIVFQFDGYAYRKWKLSQRDHPSKSFFKGNHHCYLQFCIFVYFSKSKFFNSLRKIF